MVREFSVASEPRLGPLFLHNTGNPWGDSRASPPEVPVSFARLEIWESSFKWVVAACDFCGRRHVHGAGRVGIDNPLQRLGHRSAYCRVGGYSLSDEDPARTAQLLQLMGARIV